MTELQQDPIAAGLLVDVEGTRLDHSPKLSNTKEFNSLLSLLDDPDVRVAEAVVDRLRSMGSVVFDPLLDFLLHTSDELAQFRASSVIRKLNEDRLAKEFVVLSKRLDWGDPRALEDGAFLIARYGYPRLDVERYRVELSALAGMLRQAISGVHSPLEMLAITNDFFFEKQRFRGNQSSFLEADNSYLNRVLDRKIGIPISLAVLYLLVARMRVGLPFSGSSAPGHFLVRFDGTMDEPLFIDAFNGGVVLRKRDIKRFLDASQLSFNEAFLEPAEDRAILLRMMRNLILVFGEAHDTVAQCAFERFVRSITPNPNLDNLLTEDIDE